MKSTTVMTMGILYVPPKPLRLNQSKKVIFMNDIEKANMLEIIKLCNRKIKDQKDHESTSGYGEDYNDGRIVGGAALARRILNILKYIEL